MKAAPVTDGEKVSIRLPAKLSTELELLAGTALAVGRARGHVHGLGELVAVADVLPADVVRRRYTGRLELITPDGRTVSFTRVGGVR